MADNQFYRTLICGELLQCAALSVGGAAPEAEELETACYRDGRGRLTVPGSSLAGALIETAARIFPGIIEQDAQNASSATRRITGKQRDPLASKKTEEELDSFLGSVWLFQHAHTEAATEFRQGVGLRHATGASTSKQGKRALFDFEVVPVGAKWDFFLEIDTHRGGAAVEALAVLALNEWRSERGWLGRAPARGTGWIRLQNEKLIRLPRAPACIACWPDNSLTDDKALENALRCGAQEIPWERACQEAARETQDRPRGAWHYLILDFELASGMNADGYGYDVLQVGGHPQLDLRDRPDDSRALRPFSLRAMRAADAAPQDAAPEEASDRVDAPFVRTRSGGREAGAWVPFLPGGGLRGPLRHAAARLARSFLKDQNGAPIHVRDPNDPQDPLTQKMAAEAVRRSGEKDAEDQIRRIADVVTRLFGAEELSARILVRDAALATAERFLTVRAHHHAEDEFCGGVYGPSKFDREALLQGEMWFRVIVEFPTAGAPEIAAAWHVLAPALRLARLGHLPVGGGKWRGAGWLPWRLRETRWVRAGESAPLPPEQWPQEFKTFAESVEVVPEERP